MRVKKEKSKNTIMTVAEAGRLGAMAKGYNVGVKYIGIGVSTDVRDLLNKYKGELSHSTFLAKLMGVEYDGQ